MTCYGDLTKINYKKNVTIQKIGVKGSLSAIAAALAAVPSVRTKEHA